MTQAAKTTPAKVPVTKEKMLATRDRRCGANSVLFAVAIEVPIRSMTGRAKSSTESPLASTPWRSSRSVGLPTIPSSAGP